MKVPHDSSCPENWNLWTSLDRTPYPQEPFRRQSTSQFAKYDHLCDSLCSCITLNRIRWGLSRAGITYPLIQEEAKLLR